MFLHMNTVNTQNDNQELSLFDNPDIISLEQLIDDIWQEQMLEESIHASDCMVWDGNNLDVFDGIM